MSRKSLNMAWHGLVVKCIVFSVNSRASPKVDRLDHRRLHNNLVSGASEHPIPKFLYFGSRFKFVLSRMLLMYLSPFEREFVSNALLARMEI